MATLKTKLKDKDTDQEVITHFKMVMKKIAINILVASQTEKRI